MENISPKIHSHIIFCISLFTIFATSNIGYTPGGSDVLLGTVLNLLSQDDYNKLKREDLPTIKETQMSAVFRPGGRGTCNV